MNETDLLAQLNNLKNIKPGKEWKEKSRDILLSQISAGDYSLKEAPLKPGVLYYFRTFFHQPVLVVAAILLIVLGGGIFSVGAARDSKPGDSLYIAKIISEKAQLAITFNEKEKAKLGIEFAGNRAKEITQVLAEEGNGGKKAKVAKLAENFKKEISAAKTRLQKVNIIKENSEPKKNENNEKREKQEDTHVFSANLGKDDKGMQIYIQPKSKQNSQSGKESAEDIASTSPASVESALNEAEKLLAAEDFNGALDKLEEASAIINESGEDNSEGNNANGSEKINSESGNQATSTESNINNNATSTEE